MKPINRDTLGWFSALVLTALFAAANLLPIRQLWGFNFYSYLPPYWTFVALAAVLLSMLPPLAARLVSWFESASEALATGRKKQFIAGLVFLCVGTSLFWFFSERLPLLGDGGLRAREILDSRFWKPIELGDLAIHGLVYNWILKPMGQTPVESYRIISVLSGIVYLIGLLRLASYVSRRHSVLWTAALLSIGCIVLFFGYVESYSIVAAMFPWLFLTGLRAADRTAGISAFAVLTISGALMHSVVAVLFGPALIVLLCMKSEKRGEWLKIHRHWLAGLAAGCGLLLVAGSTLGLPVVKQYILPLWPGDGRPIGIFSLLWPGNIVNWILVSGLVAVAGGTMILSRESSAPERTERPLFIGVVAATSAIFVLLWNPQLGGPLDWDLFCLPISALAFSVVMMIETRNAIAPPRWIIPLIVLAGMNVAGFVAVNASVKRSSDRFADVITMTGDRNLFQQWGSLVEHAEHNPELYAVRNDYLMKAWQSPPYTKHDSIWTLVKMAETFTASGDSASAGNAVSLLGGLDTVDINIYLTKVGYLDRFGSPDQRIAIAQELTTRLPDNPVALGTAGVIYFKMGRRDLCQPLLEKAYSRDSGNYLTALNYGVFLASGHLNAEAVPVLRRALELNEGSFLAPYYLATCYLALGDANNAKTASLRAEANAFRPEEQERIKQLKVRF
jgi:hypothetical protein